MTGYFHDNSNKVNLHQNRSFIKMENLCKFRVIINLFPKIIYDEYLVALLSFLLELLGSSILLLNHLPLCCNLFPVLLLSGRMGNIEIDSCMLSAVRCHGLLCRPSNLSFHLPNFIFACLRRKGRVLQREGL